MEHSLWSHLHLQLVLDPTIASSIFGSLWIVLLWILYFDEGSHLIRVRFAILLILTGISV